MSGFSAFGAAVVGQPADGVDELVRVERLGEVGVHADPVAATEVRLLKAWTGGIGVYGAEAKIRGFSGYLCELLVLKHSTFRGVLQAATSLRPGAKIEFETAATRQFPEPLVVVDPVDGNRNVASAVSGEQLATFVHASREYLTKPSDRFFFPRPLKPLPLPRLRSLCARRATHLVVVSIPAPAITEDEVSV